MNRITINLNPRAERSSGDTLEKVYSYTPAVLLACVFFLLIAGLVQAFSVVRSNQVKKLNSQWAQWQEKAGELSRVKSQLSGLEAEATRLEEIFTPKVFIFRLFEDLYAGLDKNIWFSLVQFDGANLNLHGYVVRWEEDYLVSLDRFINNLRAREYFSSRFASTGIKESRRAEFRGARVLQFLIECKK